MKYCGKQTVFCLHYKIANCTKFSFLTCVDRKDIGPVVLLCPHFLAHITIANVRWRTWHKEDMHTGEF